MPRYVTAEKIYLLILIHMYWSGGVPDNATILVLSYITSKLNAKIRNISEGEEADVSSAFQIDIPTLKKLLKSIPHTKLGENFHESLWDMFVYGLASLNNLDALDTYLTDFHHVFKAPQSHNIAISTTSLLGGFARKVTLSFENLQFHDSMKLWREFCSCRAPIFSEYTGHEAPEPDIHEFENRSGYKMIEIIDRSLGDEEPGTPSISSEVVARLLDFQVEKMQEYGAMLSVELRAILHEKIASSSNLPMLHHTRFLEAWYAGDYPSAVDNLHRYYDYAMGNKDRSQYQYALLDMAMLNASFGDFEQATLAMNETIAAAKECKDMHCLTFSLSWLYFVQLRGAGRHSAQFGETIPGLRTSEIKYIASEAKKLGMKSIESSMNLGEAGTCLSKGHKPREAFERIYSSSHLNLYHDLSRFKAAELQSFSTVFGILGVGCMSRAYSELITECYKDTTPAEGIVRSRCAIAEQMFTAGRYAEASEVLQSVKQEASRNLMLSQYLAQVTGILKLKKALLNNNLSEVESLLLAVKASPCTDLQLTPIITLLEAKYLTERNALNAAFNVLDRMLSDPNLNDGTAIAEERIRLLNAKAMLFVRAGRPQKGFSIAMRAATTAYKSKLLYCLWEATGVLARVLCGLQAHAVARDIVLAVLYQAKETEDVALCAFLEESLALAFIGIAQSKQDSDEERAAAIRSVQVWADAALTSFKHIEDVKSQERMREIMRILVNTTWTTNNSAE